MSWDATVRSLRTVGDLDLGILSKALLEPSDAGGEELPRLGEPGPPSAGVTV